MADTDQAPIGDTERDATVSLLHAHMAAGHIDRPQLSQRLSWVRSARTPSELDQALAGLPALPAGVRPGDTRRGAPWRRIMLWMIVLSPALVLLIFTGWRFWLVFFIVWGALYYLVYRADRASERTGQP